MQTDAENMRDFVSYYQKSMKWKFSLSANLELKFCKKLLHIFSKVIFEAFHGEFLLKIGIIWFRDIRKNIPSLTDVINTRVSHIKQNFYSSLRLYMFWDGH